MQSPEMRSDIPEIPQRPTEEDFEERVGGFMKTQEAAPHRYQEVVDELQDFSEGEGDQTVRDQYYKGWTNEDFKEVLKKLGEE